MPNTDMLPPELTVTIEKIGDEQYLSKTRRADGQEICRSTFTYARDQLIHLEPAWMLERAVPRASIDPVARRDDEPEPARTEAAKLAGYGGRLYGFLFGDGQRLNDFLEFNDEYRRQARLTLQMHPEAAALWRLPWEYLHDGTGFLALR